MNPEKLPALPKLPTRFLRRYCSAEMLERLEGDLYELYLDRLKQDGKFKANLYFTQSKKIYK